MHALSIAPKPATTRDRSKLRNGPPPQLTELVRLVDRATQPIKGTAQDQIPSIPGLSFFRRDSVTPLNYCFIKPSLVLVVQGAKQMLVGSETYRYDAGRFLVSSLDIPGRSGVIAASTAAPCLGLNLELDLRTITDLIAQGAAAVPKQNAPKRKRAATENADASSVGIGEVTPALLSAVVRLLSLLDEPEAISSLAPIFQREIHYRLLTSDQAVRLRQIATVDSQSHKISRAIHWLHQNYAAPLQIKQLASSVQMSTPSFHHHFRQLTAISPLQYQKSLRLNEARRLMLTEQLDAASAAFEVGYESPSQFSREYARLFGAPPKRDVANLLGNRAAGEGAPGPSTDRASVARGARHSPTRLGGLAAPQHG